MSNCDAVSQAILIIRSILLILGCLLIIIGVIWALILCFRCCYRARQNSTPDNSLSPREREALVRQKEILSKQRREERKQRCGGLLNVSRNI